MNCKPLIIILIHCETHLDMNIWTFWKIRESISINRFSPEDKEILKLLFFK